MGFKKINIGNKEIQNDKDYRYKMEILLTKVEGRGNGIKTILLNILDIGKSMRTEPKYITKYLGIEVGAQSNWDSKRECGIINGKHEVTELQEMIFSFLDIFILCPSCRLPELVHKVKKNRCVAKCYSCGFIGPLCNTHRVMQFIIKHPPKGEKPKGTLKTKKEKRIEREKRRQNKEAKNLEINNKINGKQKKDKENIYLQGWILDESNERTKIERKKQEIYEENMREHFSTDSIETPVALLKFIMNKKGAKLIDIVSEYQRIKLAHELDQSELKSGKIIIDSVFDGFLDIEIFIKSIEKYRNLLSWYASDNECSKILMSYIEEAIVDNSYWSYSPLIMEAFYDNDIFSEQFLLKWFSQPPENSYIVQNVEDIILLKIKAEPLIEWIKMKK